MRFFAPQGGHVAPMGVKFGTVPSSEGPLLHAKFHPHRCNDKGVGPPKLKFLLRFDRNVEYKRPAGAWLDLPKGLWSYGGFKLRGSGYLQIFSAPSGETTRQTTKRFRSERTCSRSSITMPSLVGLGFHPPPGWPKTLSFFLSVCLSVCLSVTLLNVRVCAPDFAMMALEYRNDFDAVG